MDCCHPPRSVLDVASRSTLISKFHEHSLDDRDALLDCIKACCKYKDLHRARYIHSDIVQWGLYANDICISNSLLSTYAKCGALLDAQHVFEQLEMHNVVSWNALISGYAVNGLHSDALDCFQQMQDRGFSPNSVTFISVLKACRNVGSEDIRKEIHAEVTKQGLLQKDVVLGTALMDMYAKSGLLSKAQEVFDELPLRNIVSWNALISGYVQHGYYNEGLDCFTKMSHEGFYPNEGTFICVLKACGSIQSADVGGRIHAEVSRQGLLEKNLTLGTSMVDMYAKCGMLKKAREVFDKLSEWDVVSWNALISGYVHHELADEALDCFHEMQNKGFLPNAVTCICILKACGLNKSAHMGEAIHAKIKKEGFLKTDIVVSNALVDMYVKCGMLEKAQELFNELQALDTVTWNVLIAGYAEQGYDWLALSCFRLMQDRGFSPNGVTFICILKSCSRIGSMKLGKEIHAAISKSILVGKEITVGISLVDMYGKWGQLMKSQNVFNDLPVQNVISWNALITGYIWHGLPAEALSRFREMQDAGCAPDAVTFKCIFKACGYMASPQIGEEMHLEAIKQGLLKKDIMVGAAVIDMYGKCNMLEKARKVFDELPALNILCWNALISGYSQHGRGEEALECFREMRHGNFIPDGVTFICMLKACGSIGAADVGEEIHKKINENGLLENDVVLRTALVDMYGKCDMLGKAQEVFDEILAPNVVSWNALICGYARQELSDKALECYMQMQEKGIDPDAVTFIVILEACGIAGSLEMGEQVYVCADKKGLLQKDIMIGNAVVDMYSKCGMPQKAQELFENLQARNAVTWNVLLSGYAQLGNTQKVLGFFKKMIMEGIAPDLVTILALLSACSHAGLIEEGKRIFDEMETVYCLLPTSKHYACLVDLFSRSGYFDRAIVMIEKVPLFDRLHLWLALLTGCQKWGLVEVGRWAFEQCVQLNEKFAPAYVCMRNIYLSSGMLKEADSIEAWSSKNGMQMMQKYSWGLDIVENVNICI